MKNLVFLFVFIFSPLASKTIGDYGNTKTGKLMEILDENESKSLKTVEVELIEAFSSWQTADASYYDPNDPKQTREDCDGRGAFGRLIKSGSIALGSIFTEKFRKKGLDIFIQIKDFDVSTPFGKGIFRVDDKMKSTYTKEGETYIDFFLDDLSPKHIIKGRFNVMFKIFKIEAADN